MPLVSIEIEGYARRAACAPTPALVLLTDETDLAALPPALRAVGDHIWLRPLAPPAPLLGLGPGIGWLLWGRGERLLQGTAAQIRFAFSVPGRRYFVPVHYSSADSDLDLIGLEPRWFSPASKEDASCEDSLDLRVRIAAGTPPQALAEPQTEPWQRLRAALRCESAQPGSGIAPLAELAQAAVLHRLLHSLCLRNLVVALLRRGDLAQAGSLLQQARAIYPDYRELDFAGAHLAIAGGQLSEAVACLHRATAGATGVGPASLYVGSGGESGYRAHCLLALLAEKSGCQAVALHHFLTGVRQTPALPAAVAGVLRQRLSPALFSVAHWELSRLGRSEPRYQAAIFDFFLLHRAWDAARRLLSTWLIAPEIRAGMESRLAPLSGLEHATARPAAGRFGVALSGPFLLHSSVARINRYLGEALLGDQRLEAVLDPAQAGLEPAGAFPGHERWESGFVRLPARLDVTVRHGWPPDFAPPPTGKLALILPWEFGSIPQAWRRGLERVDRIFVPSQFVRGVLLRAGVEPGRIAVIPNGVDLDLYGPEGERARPEGARRVTFLFVGGAIRRKGMDVLLRAWRAAFDASDDATLVIKDLGAQSFYRHLHLRAEIEAVAADPQAAPILYLPEEWSEARLPALYRGCDVVVLPYRGEGFGLPLLEGLTCGKPVITTGAGPALEFCPPEASWLVAAEEVEMPREMWPSAAMTAPPTWFEPSAEALTAALRDAYHSAIELPRRGALGSWAVRRSHGWSAVTAQYCEQIAALAASNGAR